MAILMKILKWLPKNIVTVFGVIQGLIKIIKELATGIVNLLSILIADSKYIVVINAVRSKVNAVDRWVEKVKAFFLKAAA